MAGDNTKIITTASGATYQATFTDHHIINTDTFSRSDFLQRAKALGLWNQDARHNLVPLLHKVDGVDQPPLSGPVRMLV